MSKPLQITVGGPGPYDPVNNATEISIPILDGAEFYLEKEGQGTMPYSAWQVKSGGGVTLLGGLKFVTGDTYTIHVTGYSLSSTATNYTNGYHSGKVLNALFGRLGWSDASLNATNTTSASGRKFDDGSFHTLVQVPLIKKTVPDQSDWNSYFETKQKAVILKALNSVFNRPEFFEQTNLYERDDDVEATVAPSGRAVGYEIEVCDRYDVSQQIRSIDLYFDGAATFNVYLFKQGSLTPVKTQSVTTVANEKVTVSLTDWVLNRKESKKYFLVYFENDLGGVKAIRESNACYVKTLMFEAEAISAEATGATTFQRSSYQYTLQPQGLNAFVTSFRDQTQNIINQPHLFDELIGLHNAYTVLEDMNYAVRSNSAERVVKDQLTQVGLQLDLNGTAAISDGPKTTGLRQRIERETTRVREAFYPKVRSQTVNLYADNKD